MSELLPSRVSRRRRRAENDRDFEPPFLLGAAVLGGASPSSSSSPSRHGRKSKTSLVNFRLLLLNSSPRTRWRRTVSNLLARESSSKNTEEDERYCLRLYRPPAVVVPRSTFGSSRKKFSSTAQRVQVGNAELPPRKQDGDESYPNCWQSRKVAQTLKSTSGTEPFFPPGAVVVVVRQKERNTPSKKSIGNQVLLRDSPRKQRRRPVVSELLPGTNLFAETRKTIEGYN